MSTGDADGRSLHEHTVLLTGGTSGIGKQAAISLADRGATVAIVGRNEKRGAALADDRSDGGTIQFHQADLSEQDEVRSLAAAVRSTYDEIDVLAHNAGLSMGNRTETTDGIEMTFAVNHLAPYLLTHELLDSLASDSRIVVTTSGLHRSAELDFSDLEYESADYDALDAYSRSKLANVAFTIELAERLDAADRAVTANCFHPGFVPSTDLFRNARLRSRILVRLADFVPGIGTGPETGAQRLEQLALDPEFGSQSGVYLGGDGVEEPASTAADPDTRGRLWERSAEYVGVNPEWP